MTKKIKSYLHKKVFFQDIVLFFSNLKLINKNFYPDKSPIFQGFKSSSKICLIMCSWKRIATLTKVLASVKNQRVELDLFIWNNNFAKKNEVDQAIANFDNVQVFHSKKNIGGYGRFFMAKSLLKYDYEKTIFIDDDQFLSKNYLQTLISEHKTKTIVTSWGFQIKSKTDYWDRKLAKASQKVDYAGTGGMIVDMNLFREKEVFECPKRYWFVEDFWLSYVAKIKGYFLIQSQTASITPDDKMDQSHSRIMVYRKNQMLRFLLKKGFELEWMK